MALEEIRGDDNPFDELNEDQLEELLADPDALIQAEQEHQEAPEPDGQTAEPEPEQAEPKVEEPKTEEDSTEPQETEPAAEATPEEPDAQKLMFDEMEARLKHFERLAGRKAGEDDFLRRKVKELEAKLSQARTETELEDEPEPARAAPTPVADPIRQWAVERAHKEALDEFTRAHPDYEELQDRIAKHLAELRSNSNIQDIIADGDPNRVAKISRDLLEESFWAAAAERRAELRAELTTRKAAQVANLEQAKRKAQISGSGSPAPKPKEKSVDDMSIEELEETLTRIL